MIRLAAVVYTPGPNVPAPNPKLFDPKLVGAVIAVPGSTFKAAINAVTDAFAVANPVVPLSDPVPKIGVPDNVVSPILPVATIEGAEKDESVNVVPANIAYVDAVPNVYVEGVCAIAPSPKSQLHAVGVFVVASVNVTACPIPGVTSSAANAAQGTAIIIIG